MLWAKDRLGVLRSPSFRPPPEEFDLIRRKIQQFGEVVRKCAEEFSAAPLRNSDDSEVTQ